MSDDGSAYHQRKERAPSRGVGDMAESTYVPAPLPSEASFCTPGVRMSPAVLPALVCRGMGRVCEAHDMLGPGLDGPVGKAVSE